MKNKNKKQAEDARMHKDEKGNSEVIRLSQVRHMRNKARAYDHPLRLKVLAQLEGRELTVTKLYKILKIEQSVCSSQLRILRGAGLVKVRHSGKERKYSICRDGMGKLWAASSE